MAGKNNFDGEIKSAMKEKDTPADRARDKKRGIKEGSPQDRSIDAKLGAQPSQQDPSMHYPGAMPHAQQSAMGNQDEQVRMAHAAGIAHSILGGRKMV